MSLKYQVWYKKKVQGWFTFEQICVMIDTALSKNENLEDYKILNEFSEPIKNNYFVK